MATLAKTGKYGAINKIDTTRMGYYVIKFISEAYTLHKETDCKVKINSSGELVVKDQYMNYMQDNKDGYWEQSQQQDNIIPTRTVLHPCLHIMTVTEV